MSLPFSNTSTEQGILQGIYFEVNANSVTYPEKDVVRGVNLALDRFVYLAISSNSKWQFDDYNNTTSPVATTDIVADQIDYVLDFDFLTIESVEIKDTDGSWRKLKQVDRREQTEALGQEQKTSTTQPLQYDLRGKQLYLIAPSSVNVTGGLRVFFQRKASYFVVGDTVKEPGVLPIFSEYFILYPSFLYAQKYGLDKKNDLFSRIQIMEAAIKDHYGQADLGYKANMSPNVENTR